MFFESNQNLDSLASDKQKHDTESHSIISSAGSERDSSNFNRQKPPWCSAGGNRGSTVLVLAELKYA